MNPRIRHLIQNPLEVELSDLAVLQDEMGKYPYFPTLRNLLLFGLNQSGHETFKEELKKTSIYSPSRVALYHYLQKEKQTSTEAETIQETPIVEIPISDEVKPEKEILIEKDTERTFSQWLSLSKKEIAEPLSPTEREIKFKLIDEFIEKSPKISPVSKTEIQDINSQINNHSEYSDLMTETLAQIYAEQKKFDKAIRAYKILSIKYPDKKDLFLSKIEEIENMK